MKKVLFLAAAALASAVTMTSCGQGAKMTTTKDSLAYAIGTDLATMAFRFDSTLNPQILAAAVQDVYAKKGKMTPEQSGAFIREYMTVTIPRQNAEDGKKFIAEAVKNGADTLASGLAYKIETPGAERKAALGDSVQVKYTLSLPNGTMLEQPTEPVTFLLQEGSLIKAWLQGVPLIGEGGKITLFVPADLAYGPQGTGGPIGPNQALKFDIELVKVTPGVIVDPVTEEAATTK